MVTVCKTCPSDSHAYIYNDGQIEDKCVCFPCPKPSCPDNQILINKRKGQNIPGACCDLYECSNRSCLVQGKSINHNETFMSKSMPGVECICKNGVSMCTSLEKPEEQKQDPKMPCFSGEKIYSHQDTWMEDSCTNCTCINGKPKCISHFCIVKTEFKKMCPSMSNCTKTCDAGYKQNKNGCEICKCREDPNNKYIKLTNLIQLLKELNLSESDAIDIIKEHMLSKHTNPTSNNICQNNIYFSIFACVVLVIFLIGVGIYKCHNMEFSYSPMNIKKKKTVKTCELQHFTTGDNKLSTIH
ncbi:PREDICTED: cysteine-rich motor neuron 1 protein [Nicrophorus vespilloides]|uniref:Cysteine-rich motor neuron 1 protein n=1 Tax=Nicrophorus vespilloides TaxID=110193 RepID=A0ABM1MAS1_NICVS|nr:PREDICTED: cysteine-rich motor neuron 1 protein [Nicrophorus vespilloides]